MLGSVEIAWKNCEVQIRGDKRVGIPESILILAGFVFGHSAWSISDVPKGELLIPMVVVEKSDSRELMRFEAQTQEEAIKKAKAWIAKNGDSVDAWVFAREGQVKETTGNVDVLTLEAKAKGMADPIIFVQKFQPFANGGFKLIGEPLVSIRGVVVDEKQAIQFRDLLMKGVQTHPKAAVLWKDWVKQ